jgi:hypothetical protein
VKTVFASIAIAFATLLSASPASAEPACLEDMACWKPATMGNHQGSLPDAQVPVPGDFTIIGLIYTDDCPRFGGGFRLS